MSYRYPAHQIQEITRASKVLRENQSVTPEKLGEHGAKFHSYLDLVDGPALVDLRFHGRAGSLTATSSYAATLILDAERVRGVDYCPVGRKRLRTKERIPPGWHQNLCDPNLPTNDLRANRHDPLPEFQPIDFTDFTEKIAAMWNIDLGWEKGLV